ncbi:MAG TPA: glucosamine-6-phosphate deaminase [Pyrinomonadaceae bacterium]|jgi:glucosamine-6-phosphate deaminase|nr:glucosamine-6-phosphate deaminase [Pyrinomonadaceae bacterium]
MESTGTMQEGLERQFRADNLNVYVYESRPMMGKAAAGVIASELRRLIEQRGRAVVIFASAPSQNEFLANLVEAPGIDWSSVVAFHLDEYLGMEESAPQSFRRFLIDRLVNKVPLGEFNGLRGDASDGEEEARRYARLLEENPPDIGILGIGENGHLAFIDPPFCDFEDPKAVKVVQLDEVCRKQQVNDGAFQTLSDVPRDALSLTIPTLLARPKLFAIAPGPAKRQAIKGAVEGPVSTTCPASILRTHGDAHLFIDRDSAEFLSH